MNKRIIGIIAAKEWTIAKKDINSMMLITFLPVLIIGQMTLVIYLIFRFANMSELEGGFIMKGIAGVASIFPFVASLPFREQVLSLAIVQMPLYTILIPLIIAIYLSVFSIIEEKTKRTLEPLLATPAKTEEILMGKAVVALLPAYIVTVICYFLASGAAFFIFGPQQASILLSPLFIFAILILSPLMAVLSFLLGVVSSARQSDVKSAQNTSVVIILPVLGLIGLQVAGFVFLNLTGILASALLLFAIDVLMLKASVKVFSRERILTDWK